MLKMCFIILSLLLSDMSIHRSSPLTVITITEKLLIPKSEGLLKISELSTMYLAVVSETSLNQMV